MCINSIIACKRPNHKFMKTRDDLDLQLQTSLLTVISGVILTVTAARNPI